MAKLTFSQCQAIATYSLGYVLYEYHSSLITAASIYTPTDYSWNKAVNVFASRLYYLTISGSDVAAQKGILEALVTHSTNYIWVMDIFTRSIFHLGHGWSSVPYNQYHVIGVLTTAIDNISAFDPPSSGGGSGGSSIDPEVLSESIALALSEVLEPS